MRSLASLSQLDGMTISNIDDFTRDPRLEYAFTASNFLSSARDLRIVPVLAEDPVDASFIDKDTRRYPLDLEGLYTVETDVALVLPDTMEVVYLPEDLNISNPWGSLTVTLNQVYNTVHIRQRYTVNRYIIGAGEYPAFRKSIEEILHRSKQQIILRKIRDSK